MYRMLIVDDEVEVTEWLYMMFRSKMEYELDIYTAVSSRTALEFVTENKVDVVISDIHMPGMNGLQLLEKIQEFWPLCRVVFLTGYNTFQHIYEAIQHKNVKYLLKTEQDDVILATVNEAICSLEREYQDKHLLEAATRQSSQLYLLMHKDFIHDVLSNNLQPDDISQELLDCKHIPIQLDVPFFLVAGCFDTVLPEKAKPVDLDSAANALRLASEKHFNGCYSCVYAPESAGLAFWLLKPDVNHPCFTGTQNSEDQYRYATMLLKGQFEDIQKTCNEALSLNISFLIHCRPIHFSELRQRAAQLKKLLAASGGRLGNMIAYDTEPMSANAHKAEYILVQVRNYINGHMGEEISLIRMAEFTRYNPSYLSRLFKQMTGENLTDYIHDARIEKAKLLLPDRRLKIYEIGRLCGFITPHYFARVFKQSTGLAPQEFRDAL